MGQYIFYSLHFLSTVRPLQDVVYTYYFLEIIISGTGVRRSI